MFLLSGEPWEGASCPGAGPGVLQDGVAQGPSCRQRSERPGPPLPGAVPQDLTDRCQQSVREHCTFRHGLLELRQWVTTVTHKLESLQEDAGPWDARSREVEVEVRRLSQFPHLPPTMQAWEAGDPTWGNRDPCPESSPWGVCVCACVSFRSCWLNSRRRRPSCPWSKRTAGW